MHVRGIIRSALIVLGLLATCQSWGQIVNVERQRIVSDSAGWFGQAGFSFAGAKNTKSIISLAFSSLVEFKSRNTKDLFLLITDIALIQGEGEQFTDAGFGHLRYNRKLSDAVRWEVFSQLQYNSLVKINRRILGGMGPRFKLTNYENAKFYWGVAYMYEYEQLLAPDTIERNHRLSSYFSFSLNPEEQVSLTSTFYAQPLLKDFRDFRLMLETNLSLDITKKLTLSAVFRYLFDKVPPLDVPRNVYSFANSLEIKF